MISSLDLPNGTLEIRTKQRSDRRWISEYRFKPNDGNATAWAEATIPEGFISSGLAFSAGILLGQQRAELGH